MVEIFFGIITRQAIRRGTFTSVNDLTTRIGAYNDRCQPFTWTRDADELLGKIRRLYRVPGAVSGREGATKPDEANT